MRAGRLQRRGLERENVCVLNLTHDRTSERDADIQEVTGGGNISVRENNPMRRMFYQPNKESLTTAAGPEHTRTHAPHQCLTKFTASQPLRTEETMTTEQRKSVEEAGDDISEANGENAVRRWKRDPQRSTKYMALITRMNPFTFQRQT